MDGHLPYESNSILELRLLSFSTGQPHPHVKQSIIFIDKMIPPHGIRNLKIEIVGDFVIFLITFLEWSSNEDIFFLVQWKTGFPHRVSVLGLSQNWTPIADTLYLAWTSLKGILRKFQPPLARHPRDSQLNSEYARSGQDRDRQ